ncbi:MAG TPA: TIGR00730 family Rossman fold protein [Gemmataceae bacterium]|nr:TIGR00730 family Rossman fold protein [Gemmataceae bacterium]
MQRIAVFCGSRAGRLPIYAEQARALGTELVRRGWGMVYGGGHIGLMGVVADAVLRGGGEVIGVIPQSLVDRELAHRGLTELRVVETMHQRKELMADLADGFIALPGGYGTADETFEILTWAQLGLHHKPVGLLNTAGFFDPLLGWLEQCMSEDFLKPIHRGLLLAAAEPAELLDQLASAQPPAVSPKWIDKEER